MAQSSSICEFPSRLSPGFAQRSRQALLLCLAASVALHALALTMLPGWIRDAEPYSGRVLDVVLRKPEPLPVAESESREPHPQKLKARPARKAMAERRPHQPEPPPQVLALPAPNNASVRPAGDIAPPAVHDFIPERGTDKKSPVREIAAISPPLFNVAYLHNPPPPYPLVARRNGEQGTVVLRVLVTTAGVPATVAVEQSSGSSHLDDAAAETVRTWRFTPARRGTQPVEAPVLVPVVFRLQGAS